MISPHPLLDSIASANADGIRLDLRQTSSLDLWEVTAQRPLPSDLPPATSGKRYIYAIGFASSPDLLTAIDSAVEHCHNDYETITWVPDWTPADERPNLDLTTLLNLQPKPTFTGTVRRT